MIEILEKSKTLPTKVKLLLKKGVRMTAPFSVEIGEEVNLDKIDASLIIYGAARIKGEQTLISPNVKLGYEAPVVLINCQLGNGVELKGGYFSESVFLDNVVIGSNAQVRSGCLLEEQVGGNHSVGLKQTILFPFVTLGSLVNFCDCLMGGGTSRKNHSEVGSSYVHFNYTPQQDKATPSLIGDVPRGVMLREAPIFLGGQGAIAGPVQIAYGTVISAGVVCRTDCLKEEMIVSHPPKPASSKKFYPGLYGDVSHKVASNILYVANLLALRQWYRYVRHGFFVREKYGDDLYAGSQKVLENALTERIVQLRIFAKNLEKAATREKEIKRIFSVKAWRSQNQFLKNWPAMEEYLLKGNEENISLKRKESFLKIMKKQSGEFKTYLEAVKLLTPLQAQRGSAWLNDIVQGITSGCLSIYQHTKQ
ncbi:MAG TPA: UDP-N-acetylglucosamine pyrophosphorylase [Smithellaceae bacterium]|nr:UDP-N-acetylglucosamine pyrophosphorylase [Smithellaceae bacterium]HQG23381.1 UDP-N-acetylglucosamine pyrophosphorylase [Smithellaceae bacterium]